VPDVWKPMQYGWSHVYWMTIEGIPFLPCERALSKTVPIGFGSEVATLVVDNSARVGAVIDRNTGIGAGFPLSFKLLDSPTMSAYMTRQTVVRYLETAVNSTATVLTLDDVSGLTSPVWLGRECVTFSGTAGATLDPCTRGVAGYALPHPIGSSANMVTSAPRYWRGRLVTLYAQPIDQTGYAPGTAWADTSIAVWRGYMSTEPLRSADGDGWEMQALPLDRQMARKLVGSLTGTVQDTEARFSVGSDLLDIKVDSFAVATGAVATYQAKLTPLTDAGFTFGDLISVSEAEAAIKTAWDSWVTAQGHGAIFGSIFYWTAPKKLGNIGYQIGKGERVAFIEIKAAAPTVAYKCLVNWFNCSGSLYNNTTTDPLLFTTAENKSLSMRANYSGSIYNTGIGVDKNITPAISVAFDGGSPGTLPAGGIFTIDGKPWRYAASQQSAIQNLLLLLNPYPIALSKPTDIGVGVSIVVRPANDGTLAQTMLRMLHSTGETSLRGTYDTLLGIQGLGLPTALTDDAQILALLGDTWWQTVELSAAPDDQSIEEVLGGPLALGAFAVVVRGGIDSDAVVSAVHTNSAVGGATVEIADADLITYGGASVNVMAIEPPNRIKATLRVGKDEVGVVAVNDPERIAAEGSQELSYDFPIVAASDNVKSFIAGYTTTRVVGDAQASIVEFDCVPWVGVDIGDPVDLTLTHPALWDIDTGSPGLSARGRVIGRQVTPATGVQHLTVIIDGQTSGKPLCPATPVLTVAGGAGTPTSVTVAAEYYYIFSTAYAQRAGTYMRLTYYEPGQGAETVTHYLDISAVTDGATVSLTVAAYSVGISVSTTLGWLTWPESASDDVWQAQWMHDSDGSRWSA
jgi:hypothetical protein